MAKKSSRSAARRAAPARTAGAKVDGKIISGVWHKGKTYGPGDEAALAAAKVPAASMQSLVDRGVIVGFGMTKNDEDMADDSDSGDSSDDEE